MNECRRAPNKSFTLIELLVVVAIIGILMTILLPALKRASETAKRASCANNLRQWYLATNQYAGDYDEWMPGYVVHTICEVFRSSENAWGKSKNMAMVEYGIKKPLTQCPSRSDKRDPVRYVWPPTAKWCSVDYFIFFGHGNRGGGTEMYYGWLNSGHYWGPRLAENRGPVVKRFTYQKSNSIMMMDRHFLPGSGSYALTGIISNHKDSSGIYSSGANVLFYDGAAIWNSHKGNITKYVQDYYRRMYIDSEFF